MTETKYVLLEAMTDADIAYTATVIKTFASAQNAWKLKCPAYG